MSRKTDHEAPENGGRGAACAGLRPPCHSGVIAPLIDAIPDMISYKDLDGVYRVCNDAFARHLKCGKDDIIGKTDDALYDRETADRIRKNDLLALAKGSPRHNEEWITYPDGRTALVDTLKNTLRDAAGKRIGVIGISRDISVYQQAVTALKRSNKRLELATAATNIGLWERDLITQDGYFSPMWKQQLGYADHELSNRSEEWEKRLHPDDRDRAVEALKAYADGCSPEYALEFRLRHKDGSYRWIYTRADMQFDEDGTPHRLMGCHIDITERKAAEEALRQSRNDLEKRVEERTRTLMEEIEERKSIEKKLADRTKALEEINTALNVLLEKRNDDREALEESILYNVKELVEPYLDRIRSGGLSARQKTSLDIMKSNLDDIVSPFISRLSSGYLGLTPSEIHIANLIKQGRRTKEIANVLDLSPRTIKFHRENLRKKLGISGKKVNLRAYLLSLK